MKILKLIDLEQGEGCYIKNGEPINNFTLGVRKIVKEVESVNYQLEVNTADKVYTLNVTPVQIRRQKFLQELPVYIENEAEFYKLLRKTILGKVFAENEVIYQTGYNGLQKINDRYMYVYTNGSLDKNGFHKEIYSGIKGMYFPQEAVMGLDQNKIIIENLFKEYNSNSEIFYPLFLTNIMAITNGYFRLIGEPSFMKLTLWIDGKSGSGKTELAKAAGRYTFSDEKLNRECVSVTGKRWYALKCLSESSGSTCILDDVKNERVRDRRNSVRNIVDDYIRSVFQGRLTDVGNRESMPEWFDACAVITGEYLDTNESQNARIIYLKADEFLKKTKNSNALRKLQENPTWLTSVCGSYIQWFLGKMEEDSFPALLKKWLENLRGMQKVYKGISNAERLHENRNMLLLAKELIEWYFSDINMPKDFVECFSKKAFQSIQSISDETFYLLGGEETIMMKVLKNVFGTCKIRKACYKNDIYYNEWKHECMYRQPYFWIDCDEDFVWIENYEKSMLKANQTDDEKYGDKSLLIIRGERLMELIQNEIQLLVKERQISSQIACKLKNNMTKILRSMQIIYKQYRSDNKWGRATVNYPVFSMEYYRNYENEQVAVYNVRLEPVFQMNTAHPCLATLNERLENIFEFERVGEYEGDWEVRGEISENYAYKARRTFTSGKTLYRE